jgi:hypothetical protein
MWSSGALNPSNACQVCTPSHSKTAWSSEPDGTDCGLLGHECISGSCQCNPIFTNCNGQCFDATADNMNCGGCNVVCTGQQTCQQSTCAVVPAAMPTRRSSVGAVTGSDGKIYAIGGFNGGGTSLNQVEIYTPSTNTWATGAPMPTARDEFGIAGGSDGRIYVAGGIGATTTTGELATLEIYDPAHNSWSAGAPMPSARYELELNAGHDGKLYAIGGAPVPLDATRLGTVDAYDPSTNAWTPRTAMPTPRGAFVAAVGPTGLIYAMGGHDGSGLSVSAVEIYDPAHDTWSAGAALPDVVERTSAVSTPDAIFVIGGLSGFVILAEVQRFDFGSGTWSKTGPKLNHAREDLGATVDSSGRLYAVGGFNGGSVLSGVEAWAPGGALGWVSSP